MKAIQVITLVLAAGFTAIISAAPTPKPPPGPTDVNVVNTPNVTVTNPQTSVTVDNTSPIPVSIQAGSTVEYEFVGYSTDPVISLPVGSQSQACRNTYGPEARWATTREVVEGYETGAFSTFPADQTVGVARPILTVGLNSYLDPYARRTVSSPVYCIGLYADGNFGQSDCYKPGGSAFAACSRPK